MRILLVDDEPLALKALEEAVYKACPKAGVFSFSTPLQLLAFAQQMSFIGQTGLTEQTACEVAFLDIHMPDMNGIELALELKKMMPKINIIFVTSSDGHAADAMAMHASGYIKKPVTAEKIKAELDDLRYPVYKGNSEFLRIRCFGNFEVYSKNGEPMQFARAKAKEVFAYLIYLQGASCTLKDIAAILFGDTECAKKHLNYAHKLVAALIETLKSEDAGEVVIKKRDTISVDVMQLDCDYYRFLNRDSEAVNSYSGAFMSQYSWAQSMVAHLDGFYGKK